MNKDFRIKKYKDHTYKWLYEVNMWKDFSILFTMLKVSYLLAFIILVIDFVRGLFISYDFAIQRLVKFLPIFAIGVLVFSIIYYILQALIYKGKYIAVYEMANDRISHYQSKSNVSADQLLYFLEASANKNDEDRIALIKRTLCVTRYDSIRNMKIEEDKIILKGIFTTNHVFVNKDDLTFVKDFIEERI